jgi:protein-L-isoaspartate(D-aspartate) O-methyltransferase
MDFAAARDRLVDGLQRRGSIERPETAAALRAVPRHEFVPEQYREAAYHDRPLPIGGGQTISAPHIVGQMLELLELEPGDRVLEIGTGCGYHAAVTAELVGNGTVHSVEYDPQLAATARRTLSDLGYDIQIRIGDGREGWSAAAPFDGVYLTCAADSPPPALVDQTAFDGYLIGPFGDSRQHLYRLQPEPAGGYSAEEFGAVQFVQMQG